MIPTRERQNFFDDLFEAGESALTAMTRMDWENREMVDYCFWHLAGGASVADLARELAVTTSTVYRWRSRAGEKDLWNA